MYTVAQIIYFIGSVRENNSYLSTLENNSYLSTLGRFFLWPNANRVFNQLVNEDITTVIKYRLTCRISNQSTILLQENLGSKDLDIEKSSIYMCM